MTSDKKSILSGLKVSAFAAVLFAVGAFVEIMLPTVFPYMQTDLDVTYASLGVLMSVMFVVGSFSLFAWGIFLDRANASRALLIGIFALLFGVILLVSTNIYWVSLFGAATLGVAKECLPFVGLFIVVRFVSPNTFGRWYLVPLVLGPVGFMIAPVTVLYLTFSVGWQIGLTLAVLVMAAICGFLAKLYFPLASPVDRSAERSVGHPTTKRNRILVLLFLGLILTITAIESQILTGYLVIIFGHHTGISIDGQHFTSTYAWYARTTILLYSVGLIAGAFIADLSNRSRLWVGFALAVSTMAGIVLVVSQIMQDWAAWFIFSVFGFTLGLTKIPILKQFIQYLHPGYLGLGLAALLFFMGVGKSPVRELGGWLVDQELSFAFATIFVGAFALAAGLLLFVSRLVHVSEVPTVGNK